jgi:hypothetical protein
VGRKADPANWSVAKSIFGADDDNVARAYATDPDDPHRNYYRSQRRDRTDKAVA